MSERTQPGLIVFTLMFVPASSAASVRVRAFSPALDTRYAGVPVPIDASCPSSLDRFTIRP